MKKKIIFRQNEKFNYTKLFSYAVVYLDSSLDSYFDICKLPMLQSTPKLSCCCIQIKTYSMQDIIVYIYIVYILYIVQVVSLQKFTSQHLYTLTREIFLIMDRALKFVFTTTIVAIFSPLMEKLIFSILILATSKYCHSYSSMFKEKKCNKIVFSAIQTLSYK